MNGPLTVGTAGHIDHGKTLLVKALTGIDTDRLPQERARGISIELGYAPLELPSGRVLSVIDVPGHERFVRTMVAGATGVDLFLMVVDAGEGPRPQTLEHLMILQLLGVKRGVAAVTKIDAVDADRVSETVNLVRELVPACEVVPVSAVTGAGLTNLLLALERASTSERWRDRSAATRLYVDRVFVLPGAGTIATGTLLSGAITRGDHLEVLPAGFSVRVRSVQVHRTPVERADPGQRVAVGIVAQRRRTVSRGDALVAPGSYPVSYRLDIALERETSVRTGTKLHVCHGTSTIPAGIVRVGERYAQLRLSGPVAAARGDRVVLRQQTTVGGGRVLDPAPPRRPDTARLRLLEHTDASVVLTAIVNGPVRLEALRGRGLLNQHELDDGLHALRQAGGWVFAPAWLERTRGHAVATLGAREGKLDPGLSARALLGHEPWVPAVVPLLGFEARNGKLYLPGRRAAAGEEGDEIERRLESGGLQPVRIENTEAARQLEREGRLFRLGGQLAIGPDAYGRARALLLDECERTGTVSLARYRDLLGCSRRVAQLLLERFDADRLTLRVGDERRLRRLSIRER